MHYIFGFEYKSTTYYYYSKKIGPDLNFTQMYKNTESM